MTDDQPAIAAADTRLGQLQRGRGDGFLAAIAAGKAAVDDLLQCVLVDPRIDREIEARARYYAELGAAIELPLEPLIAALAGHDEPCLAHAVLAGLWRLGHAATRTFVAAGDAEVPTWTELVRQLWARRWAVPTQLPKAAAAFWIRFDAAEADSVQAARRRVARTALATLSVPQLLELARDPRRARVDRLLGELCARGDEATRNELLAVVTDDLVYARVRLAAHALGLLGDERLLPLAEDHFAREDVFADPARRLPGYDRMRRSCLAEYVRHLPAALALELARGWHGRGGYFATVAGCVLQEHATAADRTRLEAFVADHAGRDGGLDIIAELDALGRIGDPRSATVLVDIAREAAYSHARRRAVHALLALGDLPPAQQVLREALWDCEDEAAADGCAFVTSLDGAARARVASLAGHALVDAELQARAQRRLRRDATVG